MMRNSGAPAPEIAPFDDARDSFDDLTRLLNAAYLPLANVGLNYVAATQPIETTRRRIAAATACWVARRDGKLAGTISYYDSCRHANAPAWYGRNEVSYFGQFAVERTLQNSGVGSRLLGIAEERACADRKLELACDTAEPAEHLRLFYARRGFRAVGRHRWPHARYDSVVFSKRLGITIRDAGEADLPAIVEIAASAPWEKNDYIRCQAANGCVSVACEGDAIAGFMVWNREFFANPFVWLIVVEPRYRRSGVGTLLFCHAENLGRRSRMYTSTNRSNGGMRRFLERRGYRHAGEVDLDPGDPEVFYCLAPH